MAVPAASPPFVYAALEASGQAAIGHLDASCKRRKGGPAQDESADAWPCCACVPMDVVLDWNRQAVRPEAHGRVRSAGQAEAWVTVPSPCSCHADQVIYGTLLVCPWCGHRSWDRICESCERRRCPGPPFQSSSAEKTLSSGEKTLYFGAGIADDTGNRQPDTTEDTTMKTQTAPTAQQFATIKTLFADVISAEVPGMAALRTRMLEVHKAGQLDADTARDLINLLGDIVNPCNDDNPAPKSYAYLTAPAAPAPQPAAPAKTGPAFTKGMIITNAAGQIVRVYQSKTGNLYGKVRDEYGTWEYVAGAMKGARHLTAEEARTIGLTTERCVFCATPIETKESLAAGYGPDCAEKYGLPWG